MSVRILIIGDLHFRPKEIDLNRLLVNETLEIIKETKPDCVVVLGDTLDTHDVYKGSAHALAERFFLQIRLLSKLIILIGNHDLKNNQVDLSLGPADHPFTALKYVDNITLVDEITTFKVGKFEFCAVPYLPNGRYLKAISYLDPYSFKAFFSHQLFNFPGNYEEDPEDWPEDYPDNYNGHLHEYRKVKHNLTLVGTATTVDFGASPDKALMLVTFGDEGVESEERIPLKTVPLRIAYRIEANLQNIKNILNEIKSRDIGATKNIYKVTVFGKATLLTNLKKNSYYKELESIVNKIVEESVGTDLVMCKGVTNKVIMNGDYEEILFELLAEYPKELEMYRRLFPNSNSVV
jgi:predicted phosphodiesterase